MIDDAFARVRPGLFAVWLALVASAFPAVSDDGKVHLQAGTEGYLLHVEGDADDEWRIQSSKDLLNWNDVPGLGPLMGGRTNATEVLLEGSSVAPQFYRAQGTDGFYDPTLVRTVKLTFPQNNWQTLLASNYTRGSNLVGTLEVNGRVYPGVGVRYRGNTSYQMGGQKKSVNIEVDFTDPDADVMRYETLNLNNAAGDETIMRESLYFNVMRHYAVCPRGNFAKLYINGAYWGLYSSVQQEDGNLVDEWFPSRSGDRWRAPNVGGGTGGGGGRPGMGGPGGGPGGGGGGGGGFASGLSALMYLGTNVAVYRASYILRSDEKTNTWARLIHAAEVLANSPAEGFRDRIEDVLAVDRWLWFLAVENVFADDDSYFNKGADYMLYFEPESGRIHPIEHDGNEAFVAGDVRLSPIQGTGNTNRPVINRLLAVPELRQRYCAHLRTVLAEFFNPTAMNAMIDEYSARSVGDITTDTKKGYTMATYTNDLNSLKSFVRQRYMFLTNHAELRPVPPIIESVVGPASSPTAADRPYVTARVSAVGTNGLDSVRLYHREKAYGRFDAVEMRDDGEHGDGSAGDGVFGAHLTNYPAGTKVRYYVEARSANTAKAASFSPARAEQETYSYRVGIASATSTPVIINEFMASNQATVADPQGEFDDWIELHNVTDGVVDLTGRYLSDEPNNPRKWAFPSGTQIPPGGFILIWADEDGSTPVGLHASFKLAASGEELFLTDTDANSNQILDSVTYGAQETDRSWGRQASNPDEFGAMTPSPGAANR